MLFTGTDNARGTSYKTGALDTIGLPCDAAGQAKIVFTATDKRKNSNSMPKNEPLWSNASSFTY